MDKITPHHLSRLAYGYVRQSNMGQLQHNPESRRVQERLLERAQSFRDSRITGAHRGAAIR